jgi:hypothetical protein
MYTTGGNDSKMNTDELMLIRLASKIAVLEQRLLRLEKLIGDSQKPKKPTNENRI